MNNPTVNIFYKAQDIAAAMKPVEKPKSGTAFDAAGGAEENSVMTDFDTKQTDLLVGAVVQEWAETSEEDLDAGEGLGDRLFTMLVGVADENIDGELSEDENAVLDSAINSLGDFLSMIGISDEEIGAFLANFDNDIAVTVQEKVIAALPEGDDAEAQMDNFVMSEGDGGEEAAMDAAYKKKVAFRKGKKVWVNKRVSGTVRLSAKQKAGLKKAHRKAFSAKARMRRAKTMNMRRKAGM